MNLARAIFGALFGRRLPITTGTMSAPGIRDRLVIRRDHWGVPHVEASCDEDAWYALGFCHAQDRAFQIEGLVRMARGTLAEIMGRRALPLDRFTRRLGFRRFAELQWSQIDLEGRSAFEAYARGVREGASFGIHRRAHEFALLRITPTPFDAIDALAIGKLLGFLLASNWDLELARLRILREDGPAALEALEPVYAGWLPVTSPPGRAAGAAVSRLTADLAVARSLVGAGGGSNNWAVSPQRSRSGRAILANDPHLAPTLPAPWYLASLRTPEFHVAGAAFVGLPAIYAGFNEHAAWGVTNGVADTVDLFLEEVGSDGRSVRQGQGFVECQRHRETIRIRGGKAVEELVLVTPRGPVVSPAFEGEAEAISLRATWLDPTPVRIPLLQRVRSFDEFGTAFGSFPLGSLNMAFADARGNIGWQLAGNVPRRRRGWGMLPTPGWHPEAGWDEEPVPFERMPRVFNPASGFVATANNKPADGEGTPWLGQDWMDGYRAAAIAEALTARNDWDVGSMEELQQDLRSLPWKELREAVLGVTPSNEDAREALRLLREWDGQVSAGSVGAAIFETFLAALIRRAVGSCAPRALASALGKGPTLSNPLTGFAFRRTSWLIGLLRDQPQGWRGRLWSQEITEALGEALRTMRERHGPHRSRWSWGRIRPLVLSHGLGSIPGLSHVFNRGPFSLGGDTNTIHQAAVNPLDVTAPPVFIPNLRMVVELGNPRNHRFALAGGQSGNPLSPHYDDLLTLWLAGKSVSLPWSLDELENNATERLELLPMAKATAATTPYRPGNSHAASRRA